jgi:enoyl-CoA hydratase/carnithine racemase
MALAQDLAEDIPLAKPLQRHCFIIVIGAAHHRGPAMYDHILYAIEDPVATITLNRPDQLNAFTYAMLAELRDAIERAAADTAVVGIIITGAGRGFCAGLDAEVLAQASEPGQPNRETRGVEDDDLPGLFTYLLGIEKPIIAAVNGVAAGGGFVLAALSDIRFAATSAAFTTIFSKRGLISEHGSAWILPRLMGAGRALDLLWSSRKIDAQQAYATGLVEYLVEDDALLGTAQDYVRDLALNVSPASLRDTKRLVYDNLGIEYGPALRQAHALQEASLTRADAVEGVQSFVERRPPNFDRLGKPDLQG